MPFISLVDQPFLVETFPKEGLQFLSKVPHPFPLPGLGGEVPTPTWAGPDRCPGTNRWVELEGKGSLSRGVERAGDQVASQFLHHHFHGAD